MKNTTISDDCAVDIRAVRKAYGVGESAFVALDSATVSVRENEFFTLLGPSGCGKTTLLRISPVSTIRRAARSCSMVRISPACHRSSGR